MEHIWNQVAKVFEIFNEEEDVFYDAVGYDEYFGPSPEGESIPVDPRNWDLFWVTHPNGPLDQPSPSENMIDVVLPELEFPREDAAQGLIDVLLQDDTHSVLLQDDRHSVLLQDELAAASPSDDIIAKLSILREAELASVPSEPAAAPPQPAETQGT